MSIATQRPELARDLPSGHARLRSWTTISALTVLTGCLLWAYWPTLVSMSERWVNDPQYSHGFLVPLFAGYLLWSRRRLLPSDSRPAVGGVTLCLALVLGLRLTGIGLSLEWLDAISLLPALAGLGLLLGGWPALNWSWPAIAYLIFMPPLPYRMQLALGGPLQTIATIASTYWLQTAGFPAVAEGHVIALHHARIGVVEACNGLSMLVTFFALATAVAIVIRRPLVDRLLVIASAVPIALLANVLRITTTGVLFDLASDRVARLVFHDLAGWLMMPVALGLVWLELAILDRLLILPAHRQTAHPALGYTPTASRRKDAHCRHPLGIQATRTPTTVPAPEK